MVMIAAEVHLHPPTVSLDELMDSGFELSQEMHDDTWASLRSLAHWDALPDPAPPPAELVVIDDVVDIPELQLQLEAVEIPC